MNVALIGYGKMGKAIEQVALERKHKIGLIIDQDNISDLCINKMQDIDIAIEFTNPASAFHNVSNCLQIGIPIVCGSTGWQSNIPQAEALCKRQNGSMIISSNFSLGVNLFFALNEYLAKIMNPFNAYNLYVEEIHHTEKKDSPSGTAVSIAEQILNFRNDKKQWVNFASNNLEDISIVSKREEEVFGIHQVKYKNMIDEISISHTAYNRTGFALGVLLAAEYIYNKKGIHTMKEVLQISC